MRLLTLAAGMAAGYVLGTRAGRQKYEQIVEGARQLRVNPTVAQAQETAKNLFSTGTGPATTPPATVPTTIGEPDSAIGTSKTTRPRTSSPTTSDAFTSDH